MPQPLHWVFFFFFDRGHTSYIGFPHLYVCLNDFNIKAKFDCWFRVQKNHFYSLEHLCVVCKEEEEFPKWRCCHWQRENKFAVQFRRGKEHSMWLGFRIPSLRGETETALEPSHWLVTWEDRGFRSHRWWWHAKKSKCWQLDFFPVKDI